MNEKKCTARAFLVFFSQSLAVRVSFFSRGLKQNSQLVFQGKIFFSKNTHHSSFISNGLKGWKTSGSMAVTPRHRFGSGEKHRFAHKIFGKRIISHLKCCKVAPPASGAAGRCPLRSCARRIQEK